MVITIYDNTIIFTYIILYWRLKKKLRSIKLALLSTMVIEPKGSDTYMSRSFSQSRSTVRTYDSDIVSDVELEIIDNMYKDVRTFDDGEHFSFESTKETIYGFEVVKDEPTQSATYCPACTFYGSNPKDCICKQLSEQNPKQLSEQNPHRKFCEEKTYITILVPGHDWSTAPSCDNDNNDHEVVTETPTSTYNVNKRDWDENVTDILLRNQK